MDVYKRPNKRLQSPRTKGAMLLGMQPIQNTMEQILSSKMLLFNIATAIAVCLHR